MLDQHSQDTALATALHVIAHWPGARVLPVRGKVPVYTEVPRGSLDASADPMVVAAWFTGTDYGVAVTGVLAIDGDDPDATYETFGEAALAKGVAIQGNPERMTWLYRQPDDPFGDGKHPGGEVKGSGYVVLPPSRHDGGPDCAGCKGKGHDYIWVGADSTPTLPALPKTVERWLDKNVRRQTERHQPAAEVPVLWLTLGDPCPAVVRQLDEALNGLSEDGASKHPIMTTAVMKLLRLGEQGHAGVFEAYPKLWGAFMTACKADSPGRAARAASEFQRASLGAVAQIEAKPTPGEEYGCCTPGHDREQDELVFTSTPLLQHIREQADSRMIGRWSLLGSALARVVAEIPPHVVLPGYVGTEASLNLFVGLVDASGAGKSSSHKAAGRVLTYPFEGAKQVPNGTGEGLINSFLEKTPAEDRAADPNLPTMRLIPQPQVLMYVDEIGQLQVGNARNGATIDPVLRSMWNGEHVGTNNAERDKNRNLPEHSYRLCLVAGIQPGLAGGLLSETAKASGTAQRWLWLPVLNPFCALDVDPAQDVWTWDYPVPAGPRITITFPDHVEESIRADRYAVVTGRATEEQVIRSHHNLIHMKVAAAVAILHSSLVVDDLYWNIASEVMAKSDTTRDLVIQGLAEQRRRDAENRGRDDADRETGKHDAEEERVRGMAASIARVVARHRESGVHSSCTRSCLHHAVAGKHRYLLDEAIQFALDAGWVVDDSQRFVPGAWPMGV